MRRALPFWLSLALLASALLVEIAAPEVTEGLRVLSFDHFQRWKPRDYQPLPVLFVEIDEESVRRFGQWPWPRRLLAELVRRLDAAGAAAIALDMVLAEPDRTAPAEALNPWLDDPAVRRLVARLPDPDRSLAEVLAAAPTVLGFTPTLTRRGERAPPRVPVSVRGEGSTRLLPEFGGALGAMPSLVDAARGYGALLFDFEGDGVIRNQPLLLATSDGVYPTMIAEVMRIADGGDEYRITGDAAGALAGPAVKEIAFGPRRRAATDPRGRVWLHYSRPVLDRSLPAWRLLEEPAASLRAAGALIVVGVSAGGAADYRMTPLGEELPTGEIQTQALEQLLQGTYLIRPGWARPAEILYYVVLAGLLIVAVLQLGAVRSLLPAALALLATGGAAWYAFRAERLLLDPLVPALAIGVTYMTCALSLHLRTESERHWIRIAFSRYVSPNLVEYLIAHPRELAISGERRDCSFVLTDLAAFTALVETLDPRRAVETLNQYLQGMTSIALQHQGTLARIMGDALAVTFSAPMPQPDHPERAVDCALAFDQFAQRFRELKRREGIELGITRIGVNSGVVTVGNFGARAFFDYRALGDPVNTAARLESVNRHLGTRVCIAGATVERCHNLRVRPVGSLVLKGKSYPTEAFEPLAAAAVDSAGAVAYQRAFDLLRGGDPEARAAFEALLERFPDDGLAAFHLRRLERGQSGVEIVFEQK